jgi:hypothetical protein
MKKLSLKPVCAAIGLAVAAPAFAAGIDFGGSNIYMKFLAGDRYRVSVGTPGGPGSGDTANGTDNGQWTEFELRMKATISKQVEAGIRLQSRSSAAYWTDFGGFGGPEETSTRASNMKLRGAYILLTPGYNWLDRVLIGSSDWAQFDPFTIGKVRYIDRENYKGFYMKGPLPLPAGSWELGRLSLPNYLQSNYGQGSVCCNTDDTQFNEAVYIAQLKGTAGPVKLTTSYQIFNDRELADPTDPNQNDGRKTRTLAKNNVFMLKGEGSPLEGIDIRGAYYRSEYKAAQLFDQPWINSPKSSINDRAFKLDLDLSALPVPGLSVNYQYFNIGAGFYSNTAARHETDVLLTEGSEAAWHRWGDPLWTGGAAREYNQGPASPLCHISGGGVCRSNPGLAAGANGLTNNENMDFDEQPTESVQGWKGHTLVLGYEFAKTPMSLELTSIGYNNNWQNYSPTGPLSNYFPLNSDRKTRLAVFKVSHVFPILGGLDTGFKYKRVKDTQNGQIGNAADDRETTDSGWAINVGNQLFGDLYGSLTYGRYSRDIVASGLNVDNDKNIFSTRLTYNLAGFELSGLAQWIRGDADPGETGTTSKVKQFRMKAFAKVIF